MITTINNTIFQEVSNIALKSSAQEYLKILKPIFIVLNTLQGKGYPFEWHETMEILENI